MPLLNLMSYDENTTISEGTSCEDKIFIARFDPLNCSFEFGSNQIMLHTLSKSFKFHHVSKRCRFEVPGNDALTVSIIDVASLFSHVRSTFAVMIFF
jgi:hypothetical protein